MSESIAAEVRAEPVSVPLSRDYLLTRERDAWFIGFGGEQFGPYNSEREAMLFAIEAAHSLGQKGEPTRVLCRDEAGDVAAVWSYGRDPYPSGL
jgi:hypothetical protein